MEDDIDIEEHDILQDPRIKNLFPDFPQVKIEYHEADLAETIEDEDIQYEEGPTNQDYQEAILPDYPNQHYFKVSNVTSVQDSIEIAEHCPTEYPEVPLEYLEEYQESRQKMDIKFIEEYNSFRDNESYKSNDLPPEDIYHYKNKIILGTKPCQSSDTDLQELAGQINPNLQVVVLLEDWTTRLANSLTYCKECEILFSTVNALDAHNMVAHSLLVAVTKNVAKKSTTKTPIARQSLRNQARKSTANKILSSKFCNHCNMQFPDHTALIKHLYELLPLKKYHCSLCDTVFQSQKELLDHNVVHVKVEETRIKKEKEIKIKKENKIKKEKEVKDLRKKIVFEDDIKKTVTSKEYLFVPKSVVFQCSNCNIHFLTSLAGWQHLINCNGPSARRYVIPCMTCKRKFRVADMTMHKSQHEMCTKLKIYKITKNLCERTLNKCPKCNVYFHNGMIRKHYANCGKIPTAHCPHCDILMAKSMFLEHSKKHLKEGLKRNDFILIQNIVEVKTLKRKLNAIPTTSKVRKLNSGKGKVVNVKVKLKPTLKIGKKTLTQKSKKARVVVLKKMVFYYCRFCRCCYKRNGFKTAHYNKKCLKQLTEQVICEKCGIQLSTPKALKSHIELHRYREFNIKNASFLDIHTLKPTTPELPFYPECKKCKIKFNSDKHLKRHVCGENYSTCKICGEKFDVSTYKAHVEYHKVTKNTFLKECDPKPGPVQPTLLLPRPGIIKTYRNDKHLTHILYQCGSCEIVTDFYDLAVEHSQSHDSTVSNRKTIKCYICNLKFDEACWSKHSTLHSKLAVNSSDFKVLTYDPNSLLTEEWFKLFQTLKPTQVSQIIKSSLYSIERGVTMKLVKEGRIEYTLYSCSRCEICFQNSEILRHVKEAKCENSGHVCSTCQLTFQDSKGLQYHELLHQEGVNKEHFRIISFVKIDDKQHVLYKCRECSACLLYKFNTPRHACQPKSKTTRCVLCNQLFIASGMKKHMLLHDANPDFNKSNMRIEYFNSLRKMANIKSPANTQPSVRVCKVYKCTCGLHFTSLMAIEKHSKTCSPDNNIHTENCSKCGLLFPTNILVNHLCKHHSINTKISIEEYTKKNNVQSPPETVADTKNNRKKDPSGHDYDFKVYKCSECEVHFMNSNTCYKHVYRGHRRHFNLKQCITCKMCGLQFSTRSLTAHIQRHHRRAFALDRVLIVEYRPPNRDRPLAIDSYMATDRIQSLEVSSSMEEH